MKRLILGLILVILINTAFAQTFIGMDKKSVTDILESNGGMYLNRAEGGDGKYTISYQYPNNGMGYYGFDSVDVCGLSVESQIYDENNLILLINNLNENFEMLAVDSVAIWVIPSDGIDGNIYYWVSVDEAEGILWVTNIKQSDYEARKQP
jgi:hypothetical protein